MNFALGTIIVLFLLTTGIIFRLGLFYGPYSKRFFRATAVDELFYALVPAVFFHVAGLWVLPGLGFQPDLRTLHALIVGVRPEQAHPIDFALLTDQLPDFLLYNLILFTLSFTLGILIRKLIFRYSLDIYFSFLRLNNHWYYLLSGKQYEIDGREDISQQDVGYIQVDALVRDVDGKAVLYSGILENFYLSKDDSLDSMELISVYRRRFQDDQPPNVSPAGLPEKESDDRYYNMPGDYFVITYDQVINLNITYLSFTRVEEESPPEQEPQS